mgnify:CR=1 FL=1
MEISDEIAIPGRRNDVFAKLIDPLILKECTKDSGLLKQI